MNLATLASPPVTLATGLLTNVIMQNPAVCEYLGLPDFRRGLQKISSMPVVQKGAKVLVTGANGFIAAATVKILVERGFNVIGAVRTASKGACMWPSRNRTRGTNPFFRAR